MMRQVTIVAVSAAWISVGFGQGAANLGVIELTGGTKKIEVSTASIPAASNNPEIRGIISNKMAEALHDVTIQLVPKQPTTPPPTPVNLLSAKVKDKSEADGTPGDDAVTIDLDDSAIPPDNTGSLSLECDKAGATVLLSEVWVTPSFKPKSSASHLDLTASFDVHSNWGFATQAIEGHGNAGLCGGLRNLDIGDDAKVLTGFTGTVSFPAGSGLSVTLARVVDPATGNPLSGATVTHTGTTVTASNLTVPPGSRVMLQVWYSGVPTGPTSLALTATFAE